MRITFEKTICFEGNCSRTKCDGTNNFGVTKKRLHVVRLFWLLANFINEVKAVLTKAKRNTIGQKVAY